MTDASLLLPHPARPVRVLADLLGQTRVRQAAVVLAGAGLVGAAAQVSIPLPGSPVPLTGQTFAVLLVAAALGPRRGVASMLLYIGAGMVGVPWFAGGAAGYRAATLGYLVGFVLAAALVGWLAARGGDRRPLRTAGTMAAGTILIYLTGAAWLVAGLGLAPSTAVAVGVVPFIPGDILKAVLAMGLLPAAWRLAGRFTDRQP